MEIRLRRVIAVASVTAIAGLSGASTGAFAGGEPPPCDPKKEKCPPPPPPPPEKSKCNAGNGNGSDAITFVEGEHCFGGDPGNSHNAGNRGGDEIPTSGGVPNPGGNNVP
jgi:hypothetical protein